MEELEVMLDAAAPDVGWRDVLVTPPKRDVHGDRRCPSLEEMAWHPTDACRLDQSREMNREWCF